MKTNNVFSIRRMVLLCKQSLILNKKMIVVTLAGLIGTLIIAMFFFQAVNGFKNWQNVQYGAMFIALFILLGIVYSGLSFPAFRSKEKTMVYLMLPATSSEKFVFEIVTRIIVFILFMPLLFWVVANIEGAIVHHFVPELINYKFSFFEMHITEPAPIENKAWIRFAIAQGSLFVFIAAFAGASHFTKSPLLKTMFTISIVQAGFAMVAFLLVKLLNIKEFHPSNERILFIHNEHSAIIFLALSLLVINLSLIAFSWFSFKEKEA